MCVKTLYKIESIFQILIMIVKGISKNPKQLMILVIFNNYLASPI